MMIFKFCHYHCNQVDERTFFNYFASEEKPNIFVPNKLNFKLYVLFLDKIVEVFNGLSKDDLKDNELISQILEENKQTYGLNYEF